jgi:phosphopantetheinyl transferase
LCPADIRIGTDKYGRPEIAAEPLEKLGGRPCLSIAHSAGCAVAVVSEFPDCLGVGIDIEPVGRGGDGLEKGALNPQEQPMLERVPFAARDEWVLRFWCAKEAVAKALGRGMAGSPLNLVVKDLEPKTGEVRLTLAGELARQLPAYGGMLLTAFTGREDKLLFASSLVESITRG